MKQILLIISSLFIMTDIVAQQNTQEGHISFFESKVNIPKEYFFNNVQQIEVNNEKASLYRYEKSYNKGLNCEHFSFIITDSEPYKILGFTEMDSKYSPQQKYLSKKDTEKIAREFLEKIDPNLNANLSNLWTEIHNEEISINGHIRVVSGMKYKCHRKQQDDYTWVVSYKN